MRDKLILTDCDGVLLHWEWAFDRWMARHGYTKTTETFYNVEISYNIGRAEADRLMTIFNETVFMGCLPPFKDAIKYVKKLHEEYGYVFHVITSIGDTQEIVEARTRNLRTVFGTSPFYKITCLDHNISKETTLLEYKDSGCVWLEDHPKNYTIGEKLGLDCYLMNAHYNAETKNVKRINSWKELYEQL